MPFDPKWQIYEFGDLSSINRAQLPLRSLGKLLQPDDPTNKVPPTAKQEDIIGRAALVYLDNSTSEVAIIQTSI